MNVRIVAAALLALMASATWADDEWHSLFNGRDLSGWTPKIARLRRRVKITRDTFRVEDGVIKVSYDKYGKFEGQFGHLYSPTSPTRSYIAAACEYQVRRRERVPDESPAVGQTRNSGVMIQAPDATRACATTRNFPVTIEVQLLATGASAGKSDRQRLHAGHQPGNERQAAAGPHHRLQLEVLSPRRVGDGGDRGAWQRPGDPAHQRGGSVALPASATGSARPGCQGAARGRRAAAARVWPHRAAGRKPARLVPQHPHQAVAEIVDAVFSKDPQGRVVQPTRSQKKPEWTNEN